MTTQKSAERPSNRAVSTEWTRGTIAIRTPSSPTMEDQIIFKCAFKLFFSSSVGTSLCTLSQQTGRMWNTFGKTTDAEENKVHYVLHPLSGECTFALCHISSQGCSGEDGEQQSSSQRVQSTGVCLNAYVGGCANAYVVFLARTPSPHRHNTCGLRS